MFDQLATHGPILIVVDQPNTIGALPVTMARACGHQVAYLPGLSMRAEPLICIPGTRRPMLVMRSSLPTPLGPCRTHCDGSTPAMTPLTELGVLVGFDDDLAGEATHISNRIRGLLTGLHPALEHVLGPRTTHRAVLEILPRCGGAIGICAAGTRKLTPTEHGQRRYRLGLNCGCSVLRPSRNDHATASRSRSLPAASRRASSPNPLVCRRA